jgi:hypothetical protein
MKYLIYFLFLLFIISCTNQENLVSDVPMLEEILAAEYGTNQELIHKTYSKMDEYEWNKNGIEFSLVLDKRNFVGGNYNVFEHTLTIKGYQEGVFKDNYTMFSCEKINATIGQYSTSLSIIKTNEELVVIASVACGGYCHSLDLGEMIEASQRAFLGCDEPDFYVPY